MNRLWQFFPLLLLMACGQASSDAGYEEDADRESEIEQTGYQDGVYCAEVEYSYSATGTQSTYTLEVEIEDEALTVIRWPNGGWLDDSHFSPPDISDGSASFTSDRNVEYTVTIIGKEGECATDGYARTETDLIHECALDEATFSDESEDMENEEEQEY
jgi:hypothetical protein